MEGSFRLTFKDLTHEKLVSYADFLLRHYRLVDAYWFLEIEDFFGLDIATKFNEKIWAKLGEVSAKDIMKYIGLEKGDLRIVLEALKYFPWMIIASWKIIEFTDNKAIILAEKCPPQEARVKNRCKILECKSMEQICLENFVKVFNSNIKVKCIYAPPDNKPEDHWCRWELSVE